MGRRGRRAPLRWLIRPILLVVLIYPAGIAGVLLAPVVRAVVWLAVEGLPRSGFGQWLRERQIHEGVAVVIPGMGRIDR